MYEYSTVMQPSGRPGSSDSREGIRTPPPGSRICSVSFLHLHLHSLPRSTSIRPQRPPPNNPNTGTTNQLIAPHRPIITLPRLIITIAHHIVTMLNVISLLPLLLATATASPVNIAKRANNQLIFSGRDQLCLSPQGGAAAVAANQVGNGTPLITMACDQAAGWDISPGSGSVILTGTNFAMDAGSTPGNNGQLKVGPPSPSSA